MKASDLYAPHGPFVGQDLFIVGTGPSMTLLPLDLLRGRCCVLLNDACRQFPELGPVAFANNKQFLKFAESAITHRVVKGRLKFDPHPERDDNHVSWDDPDHYVFSYREPPWDPLSHHDERTIGRDPLYYWAPRGGSVSAFAVQFALYAGARSITLVGCDCAPLGQDHYVEGKKPNAARHDYPQYARGLERLWREARARGVPLVSLTPFFGLGFHERQYRDMREWLTKSLSVSPPISTSSNPMNSPASAAGTSGP